MASIGIYDVQLIENSAFSIQVTYPGVTSATGWSAEAQIRTADSPDATLLESFTITITSDGVNLNLLLSLTEVEVDEIAAYLAKGNRAFWSLKLTKPNNIPMQIIKGKVLMIRTVTE